LPYLDIGSRPVLGLLMAIGIVLFRQVHFYWTHRFTHWKPLYKAAHYLHHKNVNIGPWSGISMHPIEHLLYFSGVFLHWVVASHPLLMMFHMYHSALNPIRGHSGFDRFIVSGADSEKERLVEAGSYYHYLHHRYFTVNFGNEGIPLDKWFGSFHDGSEEAQAAMLARRKSKRNKGT
jgi:sterol desaturase/sphingolipid hydroxylase (fatty acid hydroxylase superfamily)